MSEVMKQATARIKNSAGLHARPAAQLVNIAKKYKNCEVFIYKAGVPETRVNGKSIMGVMMLAAECGSDLVFEATGPESEEALAELCALVADGFGEQ
ncbi:MAG: HPr family phosphocarrier protein [bacterium]